MSLAQIEERRPPFRDLPYKSNPKLSKRFSKGKFQEVLFLSISSQSLKNSNSTDFRSNLGIWPQRHLCVENIKSDSGHLDWLIFCKCHITFKPTIFFRTWFFSTSVALSAYLKPKGYWIFNRGLRTNLKSSEVALVTRQYDPSFVFPV